MTTLNECQLGASALCSRFMSGNIERATRNISLAEQMYQDQISAQSYANETAGKAARIDGEKSAEATRDQAWGAVSGGAMGAGVSGFGVFKARSENLALQSAEERYNNADTNVNALKNTKFVGGASSDHEDIQQQEKLESTEKSRAIENSMEPGSSHEMVDMRERTEIKNKLVKNFKKRNDFTTNEFINRTEKRTFLGIKKKTYEMMPEGEDIISYIPKDLRNDLIKNAEKQRTDARKDQRIILDSQNATLQQANSISQTTTQLAQGGSSFAASTAQGESAKAKEQSALTQNAERNMEASGRLSMQAIQSQQGLVSATTQVLTAMASANRV